MKNFIKFFVIIIFAIATRTLCMSDEIILPQGWRLPTNIETQDKWRDENVYYRCLDVDEGVNRCLSVKADFNGDGVMDEARLLMRDKPPGLGLFAFVSQKDGTFKTFLLDEKKDTNYIRSLGIEKVSPGRYKTVCGKGIRDCRESEVEEVLLRYDAIGYFKVESARMFFYWEGVTKSLKGVWIDD